MKASNSLAAIAIAITLFSNTGTQSRTNYEPTSVLKQKYEIGGKNVITSMGHLNRIVVGDSLATRETIRLQLQMQSVRTALYKNREVSARESVRGVKRLYRSSLGTNCYLFVKSQGFPSLGYHFNNAKEVRESSLQQTVGRFVVTRESSIHHFAMVVRETETSIVVRDGNYDRGWITERTILKNSTLIRGYIQ